MPYERMVANELVELAWVEEGENWMDETMDDKVSIITPPAHRYSLRSSVQAAPRSS
jgi:enoyl reductase-like protein